MHSDWPPKRAKQTLPEEELQRRDKAATEWENTYEGVFDNDLAGDNLTNDTPAADLP